MSCYCNGATKSVYLQIADAVVGTLYNVRFWAVNSQNVQQGDIVVRNGLPYTSSGIRLDGVPTCCLVLGDARAQCSGGIVSLPQTFSIPSTETYTAVIETIPGEECVSGIRKFRVSAGANQQVLLKLNFGGTLVPNQSGCAYLSGTLVHGSFSSGGFSPTVTNTSLPGPVSIPDTQVMVTTGVDGKAQFVTSLKKFNAASNSQLIASVQILSVANANVNIQPFDISCILDTTGNCNEGNPLSPQQ